MKRRHASFIFVRPAPGRHTLPAILMAASVALTLVATGAVLLLALLNDPEYGMQAAFASGV